MYNQNNIDREKKREKKNQEELFRRKKSEMYVRYLFNSCIKCYFAPQFPIKCNLFF